MEEEQKRSSSLSYLRHPQEPQEPVALLSLQCVVEATSANRGQTTEQQNPPLVVELQELTH